MPRMTLRRAALALAALGSLVAWAPPGAAHEDLTLTKLYNVREALREGRPLTEAERDIHDRGLVTLIRQHHDAIDALVAEAYGWPADLSDEQILTRLVALNKERAGEEAKGLIRWLRPEYQAPDYKVPVTQTLDLGEAAAVLVYLLCIALIGVPILVSEWMIGRRGQKNPINTMAQLAREHGHHRSWALVGGVGVLAAFLILSFYSVIGGWALAYIADAATGTFNGLDKDGVGAFFDAFLARPGALLGYGSSQHV